MPSYIIAYHGGDKPESPEEGQKQMARWRKPGLAAWATP